LAWEGPGFVDHHAHLLRVAAGDLPPYGDPGDPARVAAFHRSLSVRGITPMDVEMPLEPQEDLAGALFKALREANHLGLVQVTEAGMTDWAYFDALRVLRDRGDLPVRVRVFVASGLADPKTLSREGDPRLEIDGVKFYADGWLGPRTCAVCAPFTDSADGDDGILFLDALALSRRAEPFALRGWTIATHAIGDRAIEAVLDAYENVYGDECAASAPRIEHAQVLAPHLMERMAHLGVVACIQPAFAHSDAETARAGLGPARMEHAYKWDQLLDAGVRVITGSDYPIEALSPLSGLDKLAEQLGLDTALSLMTDAAAGTTVLSDDPASVPFADLEVLETRPA
jgi:predicted amidohydrolase YtcJ